MKRLQIVLMMLLAVSCAEVKTYEPVPIGIAAFSSRSTKGFVGGETLMDTPSQYIHGGGTASPRKIYLTTWHYEATGGESEYFRNREFRYVNSGPENQFWHSSPEVYWPMGGKLDFLGYSVSTPFAAGAVSWGRGRSTDELVIDVSNAYTQDDILFSSRLALRGIDDDGKVAMQFDHAQAWLEVIVRSVPECENIVTLHRVVLKDVYTTGQLTVTHPFGFAECDWTFFNDVSSDTDMDDVCSIYNTKMTSTSKYLDMLLPGQPMKSIVVYYDLAGSDMEMQYEYMMPVTEWLPGRKYVYDITFAPNEIKLLPTITNWDGMTPEEVH